MDKQLRIAITKGRLLEESIRLFRKAGWDCDALEHPGRKLILPVPGSGNLPDMEAVLAKAWDTVTYVERGVCDLGIVGKDTIMETDLPLYELLDLGFGRCRFVLAVKDGFDFFSSAAHRVVASKYPGVTHRYFEKKGMDVEVIRLDGSVELAPLLSLAHGIVDIVETGDTLRENGLVEIETVAQVSARIVANIGSVKTNRSRIETLISACQEAAKC
jgi:ATP phosphoribosyltransferase